MEMADIHQNRVHGAIRMMQIALGGIAVKIILIQQPGQSVPLRKLNDFPAFRHLNDTMNTRKDDFPIRVRLGQKVDSPGA